MGTNLYRNNNHNRDDHIGKRSAAGRYCLACQETLYKKGIERLHEGPNVRFLKNGNVLDIEAGKEITHGEYVDLCASEWHNECPKCKTNDNVQIVCSFTWAMSPDCIEELPEYEQDFIWGCTIWLGDYIGMEFC